MAKYFYEGTVGTPMPGMEVRLTEADAPESPEPAKKSPNVLVYGNSKSSQVLSGVKTPVSGDLQVRGESVFKRYWNRPEVTKKSFTDDGWFQTGKKYLFRNKWIIEKYKKSILKIFLFQVILYSTTMAFTAC